MPERSISSLAERIGSERMGLEWIGPVEGGGER